MDIRLTGTTPGRRGAIAMRGGTALQLTNLSRASAWRGAAAGHSLRFLFLAAAVAGATRPAAATSLPSAILPAASAVAAAQAAMRACSGRGFHVAVAVADRSGSVRVLIADDTVREIDIESARRKAHTAAALDAPTAATADAVDHAPGYGRLLAALDDKLVFVGGGVPIHAGHDLVGAIAVGGAPGGDQDAMCATAGIAAIAGQLK